MGNLWAPWRIGYLMQEKPAGCIFCQNGDHREQLILMDTPLTRIMLNRYPYAAGHLMVAPKRHTIALEELSDAEIVDLFRSVTLCRDALARCASPDGFNIGINIGKAAGAGVKDHLHMHVVPRWNGDSNFICVLADTRVIPEALLDSYDRLLPFFRDGGEER